MLSIEIVSQEAVDAFQNAWHAKDMEQWERRVKYHKMGEGTPSFPPGERTKAGLLAALPILLHDNSDEPDTREGEPCG